MASTTPPTTFNWISQLIFDHTDEVSGVKLGIFLESGLSGTPGVEHGLSHTPARVSFKMKDTKTNNKIEIEVSYAELYMLTVKLPQLYKGTIQNFKIDLFTKRKKRSINFSMSNNQAYILGMSDNSSIAQSIQMVFIIPNFLAFASIIKHIHDNWITSVFNLHSTAANHRIINDLQKLNDSIGRLSIQKNVTQPYTVSSNLPVNTTPVVKPISEVPIQPIVTQITHQNITTFDEPEETETFAQYKSVFEELDEELEVTNEPVVQEPIDVEVSVDDDDDDCPFDVDDSPSSIVATETIVFDDAVINSIDLESKNNVLPKNIIKKVIQPRPFLNNFLEWDLENLFNWISAFSVINDTSNDLSFKPLELILSKSIGIDNLKTLSNSSDYHYYNFHILNKLKSNILSYIQDKTGKFAKVGNKVFFDDIAPITKENNTELWDFIVDIAFVDIIFKIFNHSLDKINIQVSDITTNLYNIKLSESFIDSMSWGLIKLIDVNEVDKFKDDINNLYLMIDDKNTFKLLTNSFNFATKGGTFRMELSTINKYMDKYMGLISSIDTSHENYAKTCVINNLDDIKSHFVTKKSESELSEQIDPSYKLFLKCLNLEMQDDSKYCDLKNFTEAKSVLDSEDNELIVKFYNLILANPNIKKVSELQRKLNSNDDEVVQETVVIVKKNEEVRAKPIDMFSIDDDDTDFDIFELQNI